jgi:Reverse transcriptase (RNA-dependent DNA polymerase)
MWDLVDLLKDQKAVKCKWVYRIKFGANGKPNRFKARLVAKGFTQIIGLNYNETFSPVTCLDLIWILLALATLEDWEIHQIDIKTAFLNGDLDKEIYMQQPEGFIAARQSGKVCRLRKALYRLKQASQQ